MYRTDPWTETLHTLSAIDPKWLPGIRNVLKFMVTEKGILIDETIDLTVIFHEIVNLNGNMYTFAEAETVLTMCSEFCLLNLVYDRQVLSMAELQDNAVFLLQSLKEYEYTLEGAILLSYQKSSLFNNDITRPSMSLFGPWEEIAGDLLAALLTRRLMCDTVSSLRKWVGNIDGGNIHPRVFVDRLRKLEAAGLINVEMQEGTEPVVEIIEEAAGLFLLLTNRLELVKLLASLSA